MVSIIRISIAVLAVTCVGCSTSSEPAASSSIAGQEKTFSEKNAQEFLTVRSKTYSQLGRAVQTLPTGAGLVLPVPLSLKQGQETHEETISRFREQLTTGRGWHAEGGKTNLFSTNWYSR